MEELLKRIAATSENQTPQATNNGHAIYFLKQELQARYNQKLNRFIEVLKHDIKIPAIANLRALERILSNPQSNISAQQKELLELTIDSCKSQIIMLNELIQTINFQNNSTVLDIEEFDIVEAAQKYISPLEENFNKFEVTRTYNLSTTPIFIKADRIRLSNAVMNILTNIISQVAITAEFSLSILEYENNVTIKLSQKYKQHRQLNGINEYSGVEINTKELNSVGSELSLGLSREIINAHRGQLRDICTKKRRLIEIKLPKNI